jgi:hypothetical protein
LVQAHLPTRRSDIPQLLCHKFRVGVGPKLKQEAPDRSSSGDTHIASAQPLRLSGSHTHDLRSARAMVLGFLFAALVGLRGRRPRDQGQIGMAPALLAYRIGGDGPPCEPDGALMNPDFKTHTWRMMGGTPGTLDCQ